MDGGLADAASADLDAADVDAMLPELPIDIEFLELSISGVSEFANLRPVGFATALEVLGVRSDGSTVDLTGRPELVWEVSPTSRAEIDTVASSLVGLEPGPAQIRVDLMTPELGRVSDSERVEFVSAAIDRVVLSIEEIPLAEFGTEEPLQMVQGWAYRMGLLAYLSGEWSGRVRLPISRTVTRVDSPTIELSRSGGFDRLDARGAGTAPLQVTVNSVGGEPEWTGEFTITSWATGDLDSVEPQLDLPNSPAAVGEGVAVRPWVMITPTGEAGFSVALNPALADWDIPTAVLGDLVCTGDSCIAQATREGTGTLRFRLMLGGALLEASAEIEVFDASGLTIELDPPSRTVGAGARYCVLDWSLSVRRGGTMETVSLRDPAVRVAEALPGGGTSELTGDCEVHPGGPRTPRAIAVTYRRTTVIGQINYLE